MTTRNVSGSKLKQALEKFGSLGKALEELQKERLSLEKDNNLLRQMNSRVKSRIDRLFATNKELDDLISNQMNELDQISAIIEQHLRQYELFQGFLAMMEGSPSVTSSIKALIGSLEIATSGWKTTKKADELRSLFIRATMGDYLKSFRCQNCRASFIVNKEPHNKYSNYYQCPSCHSISAVKPDDSFLTAMVSEKQLENTRRLEDFQNENNALSPFKVFFSLPCQVCKQPVTHWTNLDVKRGIVGLGWGHTKCFNT